MEETILLGQGSQIQEVSQATWKQHLAQIPEFAPGRLSFMTDTHHQVRNFVVVELVKRGQPIEPQLIAERLKLPPDRVKAILDELEKQLTFLVRDKRGAVAWAYPVTVEVTPHRLSFNSGERLYAA